MMATAATAPTRDEVQEAAEELPHGSPVRTWLKAVATAMPESPDVRVSSHTDYSRTTTPYRDAVDVFGALFGGRPDARVNGLDERFRYVLDAHADAYNGCGLRSAGLLLLAAIAAFAEDSDDYLDALTEGGDEA